MALGQFAEREGDRRVTEETHRVGVARIAEQRKGAREEKVADPHCALAARSRHHRRLAAAQGGSVENVVVDERGDVNKLDRGRAPHRAFGALGAGAEQHEQRPQAFAAGRKGGAGLCPQCLPVAFRRTAEHILDRREPRGQPRLSRLEHGGDGRRDGGAGAHSLTPEWIAMIPPARTV